MSLLISRLVKHSIPWAYFRFFRLGINRCDNSAAPSLHNPREMRQTYFSSYKKKKRNNLYPFSYSLRELKKIVASNIILNVSITYCYTKLRVSNIKPLTGIRYLCRSYLCI